MRKVAQGRMEAVVTAFHQMVLARNAFEALLYKLPKEYLRPFRVFQNGGKEIVKMSLYGDAHFTKEEEAVVNRLWDIYNRIKEPNGEGTKEVKARRPRKGNRGRRTRRT